MPKAHWNTVGEVAAFCRVDASTVYRWLRDGEVEAHRLPGRGAWRVAVDDEGFPVSAE